jgi:hypothetical protein
MDSEPALTETPVCADTVPIHASDNTPPMSHPAADEENMPTDEVLQAEDYPDERIIGIYAPSVWSSRSKVHVLV